MVDFGPGIPKRPSHAVRMISNWDGERDEVTCLAFVDDGHFYCWETGALLLCYEGDEILKAWELA